MRIIHRLALVLSLAAILLPAAGCKRSEEMPARQGRITASAPYQTHFGTAPNPQEGTCFALVGYLPSVTQPGKVVPLPLFLFKQEEQMRQLVERLITVDQGAAERVGVSSPFAEGTTLLGLRQQENTVIIDLTGQGDLSAEPERAAMILASLGNSMIQFPGVEKVIVTATGNPLPGAEEGYRPDAGQVASPGDPVILGVVANWESNQATPDELSVYFDRPVEIKEIRLFDQEDKPLDGEFFQSIFNMAVVLHPAAMHTISEGMPLRVVWEVVDPKGRSSKGEQTFPILRMEHP